MHDGKWAVGYRKGRFKLVQGVFEDTSYCRESQVDALNCSSAADFFIMKNAHTSTAATTAISTREHVLDIIESFVMGMFHRSSEDVCNHCGTAWYVDTVAYIGETAFRIAEYFYGDASFDAVKGAVLLAHIQRVNMEAQGDGGTYLFDLVTDPEEKNNLALERPEVVKALIEEVQLLRDSKPAQGKYWMVLPVQEQRRRYVMGDCSMNPLIAPEDCVFKHPFMQPGEDDSQGSASTDVFVHAIPEFTRHMVISFVMAGTAKIVKMCMVLGGVFTVTRLMSAKVGGSRIFWRRSAVTAKKYK